MGCYESKAINSDVVNEYIEDLYKTELSSKKENIYVVECLMLLKYLSMDNLLLSKITFDNNSIEIYNPKYKTKSEWPMNERMKLVKDIINMNEDEFLRLIKKQPKKVNSILLEEELIKNDECVINFYVDEIMKKLLKTNAEKYYFRKYHRLKHYKKAKINRRILYCRSHNRTEFLFCFCKIGSIGLEYLCTKIHTFKYISSMNLQLNKITLDGFLCFTEICKYLPNITELLLDNNLISPRQYNGLFSYFRYLPKLKIFGIGENPIGDIGVLSLSENIMFIRNIVYLNIENCEITDISFELLCNNLHYAKELEELDVGYNKITGKGMNCFINNCSCVCKLKYLWLNNNSIENLKEIEKRIRKVHDNKTLKIFLSISKKCK